MRSKERSADHKSQTIDLAWSASGIRGAGPLANRESRPARRCRVDGEEGEEHCGLRMNNNNRSNSALQPTGAAEGQDVGG